MARVKIANWERWQTYRKDRGQPPWIKLHRILLRNPDWISLTDAQRGQLVTLWMLAADNNGVIETPRGAGFRQDVPSVAKYLSELGHMKPETCHLQVLIDHGFIEKWRQRDASVTPSRRQRDATDIVDTEGEDGRRQKAEVELEPPVVVEVPSKVVASVQSQTPPRGPAAKKNGRPRAATTETWKAFANAYALRYGVEPTRNRRVNSQLKQFCERVPLEEAPAIAAFYLTHNNAYYLRVAHSVGAMLNDSEKLRTEWQTGRKVTGKRAQQDESTATNFDNAEEAKRILRRMNDEHGQVD